MVFSRVSGDVGQQARLAAKSIHTRGDKSLARSHARWCYGEEAKGTRSEGGGEKRRKIGRNEKSQLLFVFLLPRTD